MIGVFVGMQVTNWNEVRAFHAKETELLIELKGELETSIQTTNQKPVYVRHRPEKTLLYQIVQEYWPEFQAG